MYNNFKKEKIISDIISVTPTGTINLNSSGTFDIIRKNDIIMTPSSQSLKNLEKVKKNEYVCNNQTIEKFENNNKENNNIKNNNIFYIISVIFITIIILYIIYLYKNKLFKKYK
jgi:hypothetical protein